MTLPVWVHLVKLYFLYCVFFFKLWKTLFTASNVTKGSQHVNLISQSPTGAFVKDYH